MKVYTGSCYCRDVRYEIKLDSPEDARTSLCHCDNCKRFTGGPFGVTTKLPLSTFTITQGQNSVTTHSADNGSGTTLHRQFCGKCGSGITERGDNAGENTYVFYGTLDEAGRNELGPKGEFFCKERVDWMPEIQGLFHKQEIKQ